MEVIQNQRAARVTALMAEKQLDGILVSNCSLGNLNTWLLASEGMPLHLPYNRNNLCLVLPDGSVTQFCAREPHPCDWGKHPVITEQPIPDALRDGRLGLVNPTYLKKTVRDYLAEANITLVDIDGPFHLLQAEKSQEEIAGVKAAAVLFDRVITSIPLLLTGEPLERSVVVALRNHLREMNAECEDLMSSSMVTLTSAPDGSPSVPEPIPYPGRRLQYGDRVNVAVNGYMPGGFASALGRTYILGSASPEAEHYWNLAVSAQQGIAAAAKPGVTISQLMELLAQDYLAPNGLKPSTARQIYGIGASVYEVPRNVDATREVPLQAGMTLVIAPLICPEGKDPYCCMDTFVVTEVGAKRLSTTPQELRVLD
jgi:Xaa-Pro aminopeptidase